MPIKSNNSNLKKVSCCRCDFKHKELFPNYKAAVEWIKKSNWKILEYEKGKNTVLCPSCCKDIFVS